jgi:glycosyltransferase involved in cell wall biosynthesis
LKNRRLLFVINDLDFFISHRLPIAIAARNAGMDVHVAVADSSAATYLRGEGIVVHRTPITRSGVHPWREVGTLLKLYQLCRMLQPDIVHCVTIKGVIYGGIAARLARVRAVVSAIPGLGYVFTEPGLLAALRKATVSALYRVALNGPRRRVIFQNPDDMAMFTKSAIAQHDACVLIRGAGVDLREFQPSSEPPEQPIVVVFASRMLWAKGVGAFVSAATRLRNARFNARFVLVGASDSGSPSAVPEQQLRLWHESGIVEWWGRRDDMPFVFSQSHIVCLPTTYGEGVPKVLIEAAASARPIVATNVPGCREIVQDGNNGILVPPKDEIALVDALRQLIVDPERRRSMGLRGREIAETEFAVEKVVDETLAVYRALVA